MSEHYCDYFPNTPICFARKFDIKGLVIRPETGDLSSLFMPITEP